MIPYAKCCIFFIFRHYTKTAWIERAKSSYEIAKMEIRNNIYYEDLCYQSQQAVEKDRLGRRENKSKKYLI